MSRVVLYGCETWFVILKEEHRLGVFENGVLVEIVGLKDEGRVGRLEKITY
jgi:hypothetical protein